jgi:hypothetical protein
VGVGGQTWRTAKSFPKNLKLNFILIFYENCVFTSQDAATVNKTRNFCDLFNVFLKFLSGTFTASGGTAVKHTQASVDMWKLVKEHLYKRLPGKPMKMRDFNTALNMTSNAKL